jgi:hypothetical protein
MRVLPGVDLMEEARASSDSIRYFFCIGDRRNELRAYRTLIPAYATYIAGYVPGGLATFLPFVAVGHLSGRVQSWRRTREMDRAGPNLDLTRRAFAPVWCKGEGEQFSPTTGVGP